MTAPHSGDVPASRLAATHADLYPRRNLLGPPSRGAVPLWAEPLDEETEDLPPGVDGAWSGRPVRYNREYPGYPLMPVDPTVPYVFSVWLKADKPGSSMYIEPSNQDGTFAVRNGGVANPGSSNTHNHLVTNLTLETTWTHYTSVVTLTPTTRYMRMGIIYFNHPLGETLNAKQSIAGMSLVPQFVYGNDPRVVMNAGAGPTSQRPTVGRVPGMTYFDTTLTRPIWWTGGSWINASGGAV